MNYEEEKVPDYEFPDPFLSLNGKEVLNKEDWIKNRRPEILSLFEETVYGKILGELKFSRYGIIEQSDSALDNKAIRKQLKL